MSTGASVSVPWKVWPTITVSSASFESALIAGSSGTTSSVPNRTATFFAAASAPGWALSKWIRVLKYSQFGAFPFLPSGA